MPSHPPSPPSPPSTPPDAPRQRAPPGLARTDRLAAVVGVVWAVPPVAAHRTAPPPAAAHQLPLPRREAAGGGPVQGGGDHQREPARRLHLHQPLQQRRVSRLQEGFIHPRPRKPQQRSQIRPTGRRMADRRVSRRQRTSRAVAAGRR